MTSGPDTPAFNSFGAAGVVEVGVVEVAVVEVGVVEVGVVEVAALDDAADELPEDGALDDGASDDEGADDRSDDDEVSVGETGAEAIVPEGVPATGDAPDGTDDAGAEPGAGVVIAAAEPFAAEVSAVADLLQAAELSTSTAPSVQADTLRHIVVRIPERSFIWGPRLSARVL
nr:hypothetical protein [Nakamurella lactea]